MEFKFRLNIRDVALVVCLGVCGFMGYQNHKNNQKLATMQEQVELHDKVLNVMVKQITQHEEMLEAIGKIFQALADPSNAPSDEMNL